MLPSATCRPDPPGAIGLHTEGDTSDVWNKISKTKDVFDLFGKYKIEGKYKINVSIFYHMYSLEYNLFNLFPTIFCPRRR